MANASANAAGASAQRNTQSAREREHGRDGRAQRDEPREELGVERGPERGDPSAPTLRRVPRVRAQPQRLGKLQIVEDSPRVPERVQHPEHVRPALVV